MLYSSLRWAGPVLTRTTDSAKRPRLCASQISPMEEHSNSCLDDNHVCGGVGRREAGSCGGGGRFSGRRGVMGVELGAAFFDRQFS